ncbi:MAG: T9SS type A sorting domain-containing protein [Bacteroidales bacterium]|jgi:hypothetical protein|nr:T9SS type A sorting domain-containing protein [Bacteroidales bacterium]
MKQVIFISLFLCTVLSANSQSLQFGANGVDVQNGSEMYYFATLNVLEVLQLDLHVTNKTDVDLTVEGLTTPIETPIGTVFSWCGFGSCWSGLTIPPSPLAAGQTEGGEGGAFYADVELSAFIPATYRFSIYTTANQLDEVHITVHFVNREHIPDSLSGMFANGSPTTDTIVFISGGLMPSANESLVKTVDNIRVYPNPAIDYVTFDLGNERGNVTLRSATGAVVRTIKNVTGFASTNVQGLASGLYFYVVESETGASRTGKLVVK